MKISLEPIDETNCEAVLNYEIKPCEEEDAEFFEEKIDEISDSIAPPEEGAEEEYVFLKITDDEGKVIAGVHGWNSAHIEMMWVDEKQHA